MAINSNLRVGITRLQGKLQISGGNEVKRFKYHALHDYVQGKIEELELMAPEKVDISVEFGLRQMEFIALARAMSFIEFENEDEIKAAHQLLNRINQAVDAAYAKYDLMLDLQ